MTLPLTQVIVIVLTTGLATNDGVGDGSDVTIGFGEGC